MEPDHSATRGWVLGKSTTAERHILVEVIKFLGRDYQGGMGLHQNALVECDQVESTSFRNLSNQREIRIFRCRPVLTRHRSLFSLSHLCHLPSHPATQPIVAGHSIVSRATRLIVLLNSDCDCLCYCSHRLQFKLFASVLAKKPGSN
jgi:hypothetical protein